MKYFLPLFMLFAMAVDTYVVSRSKAGRGTAGTVVVHGKIDYKCESPCPIGAKICRCSD